MNTSKMERTSTLMQTKPKGPKLTEEEIAMASEIKTVEKKRLEVVFKLFSGSNKSFDLNDIHRVLQKLNYLPERDEVEQMIWEVDEDLDNRVNWYEFELMFKRCIADPTGLEPRNLFNLVQFLMYDQNGKGKITVEDTLELLFVRCGRVNLDDEIFKIFGADEKTADGQEKQITYHDYLIQMKKKDYHNRVELEKMRKTVVIGKTEEP